MTGQNDYTPAVIDVRAVAVPIDVDAAVKRWEAYQSLCQKILTDDDYATISGKKARKRSGWRKLGRFMGVSIEIASEERWERGDTFGYTFTVRASTRDGQYQDGDGLCDSTEFTGRIACTEHNVRSKALTRAKNRATADLIGGGEVSAEELDNGGNKPGRKTSQKSNGGAEARKQVVINGKWIMPERPMTPQQLKEVLGFNASKKAGAMASPGQEPSQKQVGLLASKLEEALGANQDAQVNRYTFTGWITGGVRSLTKVGIAWIATLLDWLLDEKDATNDYPFKAHAVKEANAVLRQAMLDQGQQELPTGEAAKSVQEHLGDTFGNIEGRNA